MKNQKRKPLKSLQLKRRSKADIAITAGRNARRIILESEDKMKEITVHFDTKDITFFHVKHWILKADIGLLEIITDTQHIYIGVDKATHYEERGE